MSIIDDFHKKYYEAMPRTTWLGVKLSKNPMDLMTYQEIIYAERPDLIVETGTLHGGSALFFASICELVEHGTVLTIDTEHRQDRPEHNRIRYVLGSSLDEEVLKIVREAAQGLKKVMVVLDSQHEAEHVKAELEAYKDIVRPGCLIVVEDTNINGHPVLPDFGPGPKEAVEEFLVENAGFEVESRHEKFMMTFNNGGYLRRVK